MSRAAPPTVVLLAAAGTLTGVDPLLRSRGARVVRVNALERRPIDPSRWIGRLDRFPTPDTVVVTSRAAVASGVRAWRASLGRLPPGLEFWAVGPATAAALRSAGARRVRRPGGVGAARILRSIGRTPRRSIVHFRSDVAGPGLARALRSRGHRVADVVVYRIGRPRIARRALERLANADLMVATSPSGLAGLRRQLSAASFARVAGPGLARALRSRGHRVADVVVYRIGRPRIARRALERLANADLMVATSPSGLAGLRRQLSAASFARVADRVAVVVLGERSGRAARRLGFRSVSVAPTTTAGRFTRHLLRELRHARP